jgi:uncharacterized protein
VLDAAGVLLDEQPEGEDESVSPRTKPVDPEELERLGAFKDFIDTLDLSDLDEPRS